MSATATTAEVVQNELEAVQPYSMHVSSKYLELTNKKLQLTRLPREIELPNERRWDNGTPKAVLEPLLDYWLEKYDWRTQEQLFNTTLPQYRTTVTLRPTTGDATRTRSLRIHFVHKRSQHKNAIPLLFCHTWPASFVEVHKIIDALTDPQSPPGLAADGQVAFHVVAPSIPGFGFSDSSGHDDFGVQQTAEAFHQVMQTLGYSTYVSHGTGWGFHICRALALGYGQHCKAVHTANPWFAEPTLKRAPVAWIKYRVARWTRGKLSPLSFGYLPAEVEASACHGQGAAVTQSPRLPVAHGDLMALASLHAQRPQTLAFSLCDSPIGLLASLLDSLHTREPAATAAAVAAAVAVPGRAQSPFLSPSELEMQEVQHGRSRPDGDDDDDDDVGSQGTVRPTQPPDDSLPGGSGDGNAQSESYTWTPTELLNWTMLQWLPGPEASLRWLRCASAEASSPTSPSSTAYCRVPLGISSFWGSDGGRDGSSSSRRRRRSGRNAISAAQSPLMWGSAVWNVRWVRRHRRRAHVSAAWEAADQVVVDMREYFGTLGAALSPCFDDRPTRETDVNLPDRAVGESRRAANAKKRRWLL